VKKTVSEGAREVRWKDHSKGKVQRTEKKRSEISEDLVGGRARVTIDEERVL